MAALRSGPLLLLAVLAAPACSLIAGLGDYHLTGASSTGEAVKGLSSKLTSLSAGDESACALTTGGDVYCWGYSPAGEVGSGAVHSADIWATPTGL